MEPPVPVAKSRLPCSRAARLRVTERPAQHIFDRPTASTTPQRTQFQRFPQQARGGRRNHTQANRNVASATRLVNLQAINRWLASASLRWRPLTCILVTLHNHACIRLTSFRNAYSCWTTAIITAAYHICTSKQFVPNQRTSEGPAHGKAAIAFPTTNSAIRGHCYQLPEPVYKIPEGNIDDSG